MRVLIPFAARRPKTRLASALSADERAAFARAMLDDVRSAVRETGYDPEVLATAPLDLDDAVTVDERPLTQAVNDALAASFDADAGPVDAASVAVVMSDLALATPRCLRRLFEASADVVVAPGRGGGTNALVVRHPEFRVDYHGASFVDHRCIARDAGASVEVVDSMRLATDIDEPDDLAELLIHGDGAAHDWLVDAGFELDVREGRVGVARGR
jgi:2-phospho-L-lactate guanylyltransferase